MKAAEATRCRSLHRLNGLLPSKEHRGDQALSIALGRIATGYLRRRVLRRSHVRVRLAGRDLFFDLDLRTPTGLHIYRHGWWDSAADAVDRLVPEGGVVIDGGANVGCFTLAAAAVVGRSGVVHAVEASPGTAELLRRTVAANPGYEIHVHEAALAESEGELEFTTFEAGSGASSLSRLEGGAVVRVRSTTLDVLTADLPRVDLVKLDLEGAELRALKGASRLLSTVRPSLIVELEPTHLERLGDSVQELEGLIRDADYEAFGIVSQGSRASFSPLPSPWRRPAGQPNIVVLPRERVGRLQADHVAAKFD
jgi:FkbM family methyltransferase